MSSRALELCSVWHARATRRAKLAQATCYWSSCAAQCSCSQLDTAAWLKRLQAAPCCRQIKMLESAMKITRRIEGVSTSETAGSASDVAPTHPQSSSSSSAAAASAPARAGARAREAA
eukprot:3591730-Pleurochrysis_carterae.AAC.3